jgi:cob(I)alamin adenosyltransferase
MTRKHHGDQGQTSLFDGARVSKFDTRIAALGTVDELNAALGVAMSSCPPGQHSDRMAWMQTRLLTLGSDLANPGGRARGDRITPSDVSVLDEWLDAYRAELPLLQHFILPGGTPAAASVNLARTICRRAEREVFSLDSEAAVSPDVPVFLNRLSDVLFELARALNHDADVHEHVWLGPRDRPHG